jgi:hypothetical protein
VFEIHKTELLQPNTESAPPAVNGVFGIGTRVTWTLTDENIPAGEVGEVITAAEKGERHPCSLCSADGPLTSKGGADDSCSLDSGENRMLTN